MFRRKVIRVSLFSAALVLTGAVMNLRAGETNLEQEVSELRAENAVLKKQVQQQGSALDKLSHKVDELETANASRQPAAAEDAAVPARNGFNVGKVNLSAEGGVGFFETGSQGFSPQADFRVDEARLFVEAPIWNEVYFYGDVDLATRENTSTSVQLGELYLDFQDVSQLWGHDNQLNIRAGRLNIPFGEEYLSRYAIDNPLISHSVSDLWGVDPGVEIYGTLGKFSYLFAVQNGSGANGVQDFDGDKAVIAKFCFDPNRHWHFSVSGMRTGDSSVENEFVSAEWFGGGFFRAIGMNATTFHADLIEGDVTARWNSGHVSAFGGFARANDNDPAGGDGRDVYYYSVEGVQNLPKKFYVAARFSGIMADKGFPIVGNGNFGEYFYTDMSTELWRLSLGLGYRFSDRLVIKTEYSLERGKELSGESRDHEDFFGTEAAFKF